MTSQVVQIARQLTGRICPVRAQRVKDSTISTLEMTSHELRSPNQILNPLFTEHTVLFTNFNLLTMRQRTVWEGMWRNCSRCKIWRNWFRTRNNGSAILKKNFNSPLLSPLFFLLEGLTKQSNIVILTSVPPKTVKRISWWFFSKMPTFLIKPQLKGYAILKKCFKAGP